MPIYRYNGTILYRHGGIAFHERCCCDDCKCNGCTICSNCCIEWGYFNLYWSQYQTGCCDYMIFEFGNVSSALCEPGSSHSCTEAGGWKGPYWTSDCTYELPGLWSCSYDDGGGGGAQISPVGCGKIQVKIVSDHELEVTVVNGPPPPFLCEGTNCEDALTETIHINIRNLSSGSFDSATGTICDGASTPSSTTNPFGLNSTPFNCIGEVDFGYTLHTCCPENACAGADGGGGGGGGGDPTGCCDDGYGNFTTTTQANCQGSWSSSPCDEGYP